MYPASVLEATLTLLLLLVGPLCYKLVLALVAAAAQNAALQAAEDQNPLGAEALLERSVQETGAPIHHGMFQAINYPGAQFVQPVQDSCQETQQAFLLGDALIQAVGIAQESQSQRNLPAAMVADKFKVRDCI